MKTLVDGATVHVHPDHSIEVVLERLAEGGDPLPVVARSDARRVEGVITLDSIVSFIHRRKQRAARTRPPRSTPAGGNG